jgi:hypothetical protein
LRPKDDRKRRGEILAQGIQVRKKVDYLPFMHVRAGFIGEREAGLNKKEANP